MSVAPWVVEMNSEKWNHHRKHWVQNWVKIRYSSTPTLKTKTRIFHHDVETCIAIIKDKLLYTSWMVRAKTLTHYRIRNIRTGVILPGELL